MKLAVYGKGGIGKSTISANISAALADAGLRVLQIGCDPKHDSTRLLLGNKVPITVLDYIRGALPEKRVLEDIVFTGYGDVACVEAGGPEPGVGCAGRGIITTFDLLRELGLRDNTFDITLYDVLGDVVCGGFAVPIRNEFADAVLIVTSGEFMSLYAANNIIRGIRNFTGDTGRIAGILCNARGIEDEETRVLSFAEAVSLPVVARIPRSNLFGVAEREGYTLIQNYPDSDEAALFRSVAGYIMTDLMADRNSLYPALPLDDTELESLILHREEQVTIKRYVFCGKEKARPDSKLLSPSVRDKKPLIGCAFAGAVSVTTEIQDTATVMHGPKSCVLMAGERIIGGEIAASIRNHRKYQRRKHRMLYSTDLSDEEFIYSGEKRLEEKIEDAIRDGYTHIFIVQACPPAIIGDNIEGVAERVRRKSPHVSVYPVPVQGNLTGDFSQGIIDTYRSIAGSLIKAGKKTDIPSVNILAGKMFAGNDENNFKTIQALLSQLNITVNCCCINKTSLSSLMSYGEAWLNIPTEWDAASRSLYTILSEYSPIPFLIHPLPVGFSQTAQWITGIGSFFGCEERAQEIISRERKKYLERISVIRPHLAGKRILIATQRRSVDWILELAEDLEMDVIQVGLMYSPSNDYYYTWHSGEYPVSEDYSVAERSSDIANLKPDLVLYSYPPLRPYDQSPSHIIPYSPDYGFQSGVLWAERLSRVVRLPRVEGWKIDGGSLL